MRLNKLDLNLLVCLDALLIEKSVRRAAERVFLSQPAMSCALSRLRSYFDDDILIQVGRTMVPSSFGQSLASPVRDMLLQVQTITSRRPSFDAAKSDRRIILEASDYITTVLMPRLLARASQVAPSMRFDLRLLDEGCRENLERGTVDLLITVEAAISSEHPKEQLFSDTFSCVVWSENALIGDSITLEEYLNTGHVITEWGSGRFPALDEMLLEKLGYARRREITAPSFSLTPQLVVGTHRIATVQTRLARFMARFWPLKILPSPVELPPIVEVVQWHKHQERDPAIQWVRQLLKSVSAELMQSDETLRAPGRPHASDRTGRRTNRVSKARQQRP